MLTATPPPRPPQITYKVEISYYEVYNERIHDLLASNRRRGKIQVRLCATAISHADTQQCYKRISGTCFMSSL